MCWFRIVLRAFSTLSSSWQKMTLLLMIWLTVVVFGFKPSAVARAVKSFSVRMPMKVSPSPIGRQPMLASRILRAASASVVLGVVHSTRRLINSRTIMIELLLHGGRGLNRTDPDQRYGVR